MSIDDARGGKVPKKFAGGGMAGRAATAFTGGLQNSWRMANARARQYPGTPPFNPDPKQPFDPSAPSTPIGNSGVPPIVRARSTQIDTPQPDGSAGPGSGYGVIAAPPMTQYRQGGRVQKFQLGGAPAEEAQGTSSLLTMMRNALGITSPRTGAQTTPQEGRIVYDEQGKPVWMTPTGGGEAYNPQYGGATPGGAKVGGATPGGNKYGGNTYGGNTYGGNTYGGATPGGWRHRYPVHDTPTADPGETGGEPLVQRQPAEPPPDAPIVEHQDEANFVPGPMPRTRTGGGGGGGGGGGAWKRLGDQTRTEAYDPVKDRMDARNTGILNEDYSVNPMVYASSTQGGIQLGVPGQNVYRRGGRVQRMEGGGTPQRFAKNEERLINPRVTPGMAEIPVGRGRASLGATYDPTSRYGAVEGGYEHPVGRDTTLGVYGNVGKDLGPEGASARPEWGVGVRGRVRFDEGGLVGKRQREQASGIDPVFGGGGGAGGGGVPDFGGGDGSAGTGGVGGSATDGSGGSAAAGVGGDDGGTYRRGGRVQRFAGGGQPQRLPVPQSGREYGDPNVPQGGGEATSAGQAEADALTAQWRQEALAAAQTNQQAAEQRPSPGGNRYGGNTYGGNTYGGNTFGGGRYGASAGPGETGGQPDMTPPSRPIHGATFPGPSPNLTGPSRDTPRPPPSFAGEEARANETPRPPLPPTRSPPPPFAGEEARADESARPPAYEPGDTGTLPQPPIPGSNAGTERSTDQDIHPASRPGPGGRPVATGRPQAGRDTSGQDEADRLTREWNEKNQKGQPTIERTKSEQTYGDDKGKKGAVDTKAPMQQGVGEPEGGYGLQGPGKNVATNNAARDYLGAATTFADWALKDAGPEKKEQAQAALFSGKGAATTHEVGALMMAVDPENKMPLDKRFDAAAKLAHDFHMSEGDVKMASESAFNVIQFGVTKAREHGAAAVKAIQAGDEKGALNEIMSGYTWLADKATAAVKDGSIVVTGDDGKVRAQIPLQPGTVNNLAMGMMSGQLPWDAIRRGSSAAGAATQPTQAVDASYPPAGNAGSAAQSQAAPAAPAPAPAATSAAPAPVSATPAAPAPALDTTPPVAQPKPSPPASAPSSAAPVTPRPAAPKPSPPTPSGGVQGDTRPLPGPVQPSTTKRPIVAEPESKTGETSTAETKTGGTSTASQTTSQGDKTTESKTTEKTEAASGKDNEAQLKKWHEEHPYEPPPGEIERKTSPVSSGVKEVAAALDENQRRYDKAVQDIYKLADTLKVPAKERRELLPKRIAEVKAKFDHTRNQLEKQRDRVIDRDMAAEQREREKPERKVTAEEEDKFAEKFKTRAEEIMKGEGRTPSQKQKAKDALERSVLRYQVTPGERKELENLSREVWRANEGMDVGKSLDTVVGMTEIHAKDTGKTMNFQKGANATSFRPVARTIKGDYVVLLPSEEKVTIPENVYRRITNLHRQNWGQQHDTTAQKEEADYNQSQARKDLGKRTLEALTYTNPFLIGPRIGTDIGKAIAGDKK